MLGMNASGNQSLFMAQINDANGAAITVAASATPGVVLDPLFTEVVNNTGPTGKKGLTFAVGTGLVTCAESWAAGKYLVTAVAGNAVGGNAANYAVGVYVGSTLQGIEARKVEPAAAVQSAVGPAVAVVTLAVGDTVSARLRVGTNADVVTLRDFALVMQKIED
jgi:hypothetical protein